ncbi:hypothetical protein ACA348_00630 [Orientia tsutsugamushi]|uniref:hypothetical protein n=1 Tax=Orientia tsutsugamushi TaxID=784 RepID=UPI003529AF04
MLCIKFTKKYHEAVESCNLAIKYDPNCLDAYCIKGMIFEKLGKHQDVIKNYDMATIVIYNEV